MDTLTVISRVCAGVDMDPFAAESKSTKLHGTDAFNAILSSAYKAPPRMTLRSSNLFYSSFTIN